MKTSREEVYKAFDTERDYQDRETANPQRPDMVAEFGVADGLTAIRYNLRKAEEAWYQGHNPHHNAMNYLRKVAGIVVKLAEEYGIPQRS